MAKEQYCPSCEEDKPIKKFYYSVPSSTGKRWRRKTCGDCQVRGAKERNKKKQYKADMYRCMDDPWEFYRPGIVLHRGEMVQTMKFGYMPPNSVWKDVKRGTKWRVVGNEEWWQLQHVLGDKATVVCEEQRLALIRRSG